MGGGASPNVAKRHEEDARAGRETTIRDVSHDPDEALVVAIKAALDVRDLDRAMALIEVLRGSSGKVIDFGAAARARLPRR
jgi:hypothetical protein